MEEEAVEVAHAHKLQNDKADAQQDEADKGKDGDSQSGDSQLESAHVLLSEPTFRPANMRSQDGTRGQNGEGSGADKAGSGLSSHPRPAPLEIPSQVVIPTVGLSPFNNLTPLDGSLPTSTHKILMTSPTADMPMLSPFLGSAAGPPGIKQEQELQAVGRIAPGSQGPKGPNLGAERGHPAEQLPGVEPNEPMSSRAQQWNAFADRMEDLDETVAEEHATFLSDAVMHGHEAAAQRRDAFRRGPGHPLLGPLSRGMFGTARAELVAEDGAHIYQVHCYAPGCSTPVMVSEYACGVEACLASEQANMMIEANPGMVTGGNLQQGMGYYCGVAYPGAMDHMGVGMMPYNMMSFRGSPGEMLAAMSPSAYGVGRSGGNRMARRSGPGQPGAYGMTYMPQPGFPGHRSKFLGVEWDERRSGWAAYVEEGARRRQSWLMRVFASEEEAARARDREVIKRGKHQHEQLNFPDELEWDLGDEDAGQYHYEEYDEEYDKELPLDMRNAGRRGSMMGGMGGMGAMGSMGSMGTMGAQGLMGSHHQRKRGTTPGDGEAPAKRSRGGFKEEARKAGQPTSKYRGVVWDDGRDQWRAQLADGGSRRVLGYFDSQEEAARAYDMAVVRDNRKDKTNFPPSMYKDGSHLLLTKVGRGSPAVKVTSQYKGVSWNSACSKWVAVLWDRELKRARHIGSFESEEAAARAYDREAIKMLGADAGLNFRESLDEYVRTTGVELRVAEPGQGASGKGSSQYRGVSWHERSQRWEVRVWGGGKQHFIGSFTDEVDAARAYDRAVLRLRGQDARSRSRMNFPLSDYNLDELLAEPPLNFGQPWGTGVAAGRTGSGMDPAGSMMMMDEDPHPVPSRRAARKPRRRRQDDEDVTSETTDMSEDEDNMSVDDSAAWAHPRRSMRTSAAGRRRVTSPSPNRDDNAPSSGVGHMAGAGLDLHGLEGMIRAANSVKPEPMLAAQGSGAVGAGGPAGNAPAELAGSTQMQALISMLQSVADGAGGQQPAGAAAAGPSSAAVYPAPSVSGGDGAVVGGGNGSGLERAGSRGGSRGVGGRRSTTGGAEGLNGNGSEQRSPRGTNGGFASQGSGRISDSGPTVSGATTGSGRPSASGVPGGTRGKSVFRGVSWCEKVKKWRALLWDGTKQRFLGHYVTDVDAARAYDRALLDLKGPDAKTNFAASTYDNDPVDETNTRRPTSSQYKGVSFNKSIARWESRLRHNGRTYVIGAYGSEVEAARAHDCASLHLRGPAANFPMERYPETELGDAARRIEAAIANGGESISADGTYSFSLDGDGGDDMPVRRSSRRRADSGSLPGNVGLPTPSPAAALAPIPAVAIGPPVYRNPSGSGAYMVAPTGPVTALPGSTTPAVGAAPGDAANAAGSNMQPGGVTLQVGLCLMDNSAGAVHPVVQAMQATALQKATQGSDSLRSKSSNSTEGPSDADAGNGTKPSDKGSSFPAGLPPGSKWTGNLLPKWGGGPPKDQCASETGGYGSANVVFSGQPYMGGQPHRAVHIVAMDEELFNSKQLEDMSGNVQHVASPAARLGNVVDGSAQPPTKQDLLQTRQSRVGGSVGSTPPASDGAIKIPVLQGQQLVLQQPSNTNSNGVDMQALVGGPLLQPPMHSMGMVAPSHAHAHTHPVAMHSAPTFSPAGNASGSAPPSLGRGRSQFRGVSWHVVNNKYIARIRTNSGGNNHLGCFDTPEEAAQAYDVAAIALRGLSNAVTNYPSTHYVTEEGTLRPELLELLNRASSPITPVAAAVQSAMARSRRPGSGRARDITHLSQQGHSPGPSGTPVSVGHTPEGSPHSVYNLGTNPGPSGGYTGVASRLNLDGAAEALYQYSHSHGPRSRLHRASEERDVMPPSMLASSGQRSLPLQAGGGPGSTGLQQGNTAPGSGGGGCGASLGNRRQQPGSTPGSAIKLVAPPDDGPHSAGVSKPSPVV